MPQCYHGRIARHGQEVRKSHAAGQRHDREQETDKRVDAHLDLPFIDVDEQEHRSIDLEPFARINPCGLTGIDVTRIVDLAADVDIDEVRDRLVRALAHEYMLEFAGAEIPKTAAGRSLRPAMEGKESKKREALFGAIYPAFATKGDNRPERDIYAIYMRTAKWKYIFYTQDVRSARNGKYFRIQSIECQYPERDKGDEDLFDLDADPYELKNLAKDPAHRERMDAMKAQALKWWAETGGADLKL